MFKIKIKYIQNSHDENLIYYQVLLKFYLFGEKIHDHDFTEGANSARNFIRYRGDFAHFH